MSEPVVAYRRGRTSFSLGLAIISVVVLFALGGRLPDRYDNLFVVALVVPGASMAVGGFCAYMLTEWAERANLGARLARVAALTLIAPLIGFLLAAIAMGLGKPGLVLLALLLGLKQFAVPALLTTFTWSLLHVFVIRPWLSRQATGPVRAR